MFFFMLVPIFIKVIVLRNSLEFHAKLFKFRFKLLQPFGQLHLFFLALGHVECEMLDDAVFFLLAHDLHPGLHFFHSFSSLLKVLEVVLSQA